MARYERYIGYCFNDWNGEAVVLQNIYPIINRKTGKKVDTAYEVLYVNRGVTDVYDYHTFVERVANSTDLPR